MSPYLVAKYLHLLAAIVMVGTSMANGVMRLSANRSREGWLIAGASTLIMTLNRALMVPSLVLLPTTGVALALILGTPLGSGWLLYGEAGTAVLWLLFLVGLVFERKMELASRALTAPPAYWRADRWGLWVGFAATVVELITLSSMVSRGAW